MKFNYTVLFYQKSLKKLPSNYQLIKLALTKSCRFIGIISIALIRFFFSFLLFYFEQQESQKSQ